MANTKKTNTNDPAQTNQTATAAAPVDADEKTPTSADQTTPEPDTTAAEPKQVERAAPAESIAATTDELRAKFKYGPKSDKIEKGAATTNQRSATAADTHALQAAHDIEKRGLDD